MAQIIQSIAATKDTVITMSDDQNVDQITLTVTTPTEGGIGIVRVGYAGFSCILGGDFRTFVAGSVDLNSAHVATPVTTYLYAQLSGVTLSVVASNTNPAEVPLTDYFIIKTFRYYSPAGTVYMLNSLPVAETGLVNLMHTTKEDAMYSRPVWISGLGTTMAAGGVVSVETGKYKLSGGNIVTTTAYPDVTIMLEDEVTTVAGLDSITTYVDGSAITAGKYHTLLIGLKVDSTVSAKLMVYRQTKPSTEYATADEAVADVLSCKAASFGSAYQAGVIPLAWFSTLKGDYTKATTTNLRGTILGQSGGSGGVTDHGLLTGLSDDDHNQYLLKDGSRALTGDWTGNTKNITTTGTITGGALATSAVSAAGTQNSITTGNLESTNGIARGFFCGTVTGVTSTIGCGVSTIVTSAGPACGVVTANITATGDKAYGISLAGTVRSTDSEARGVDVNAVNGVGASGVYVATVTGTSDIKGLTLNTISSSNSDAFGIYTGVITGANVATGIRLEGAITGTASSAYGISVSSVVGKTAAYGLLLDYVTAQSSGPAHGIYVNAVQNTGSSTACGAYLASIISDAAMGTGIHLAGVTGATNAAGQKIVYVEAKGNASVAIGLDISQVTNTNATAGNAYGIFLDHVHSTAGTAYAIYSNDGRIVFKGTKQQAHPSNYKALYLDTDTGEIYALTP